MGFSAQDQHEAILNIASVDVEVHAERKNFHKYQNEKATT
jgi:hypothetical protein